MMHWEYGNLGLLPLGLVKGRFFMECLLKIKLDVGADRDPPGFSLCVGVIFVGADRDPPRFPWYVV